MKRYFLFLIGFLFCVSGFSQTAVQADGYFSEQNYAEAQSAYGHLLRRSPNHALYLYRYARCSQELGQDSLAIAYFLKAGDRYALRNFYLGELYTKHYFFDKAATHYTAYLETIEPLVDGVPNERYGYVQEQLAYIEKGQRYLRRVTDVTIVDSVTLPKDSFLAAYTLAPESGSLRDSLGLVSFTNQRNDRRILTDSVADKVGLFSCQRLLDGWSDCDTLGLEVGGNINYPFVLSDGLTLYFGSDDAAGLGGYDIYYTRYSAEQDTYLAPENVGFPINSRANDYMLALDEARQIGYFATDRFVSDSLVTVYTFIPNAETRILRNVDSTYLRAAAQLRVYQTAMLEEAFEPDTTPHAEATETRAEADFRFVVNDDIVCVCLEDFASTEAQARLQDYLRLQEEIRASEARLQEARCAYAGASAAERTTLAQTILSCEKSLPGLIRESHRLAGEIRSLELRERGIL